MSIKSWVLGRLSGADRLAGRPDLPARGAAHREPGLDAMPAAAATPAAPQGEAGLVGHLGAYAALIGAVRDELEHFVASHVRLHLAIAERDRFLLTSIGVRCPDAPEAHALLERFMREFKPEQIKRFLAREVIAALPNAAAIDLSQFAGLFDAQAAEAAPDAAENEYAELLAALRSSPAAPSARAFEVSVVGRWSEQQQQEPAARPAVALGATAQPAPAAPGPTPATPLAGQRYEFDLEDADGRRRVVLQSVVAGRRYAIGKGEGCELRVNGTYTSRRHAELWRENDAWWVADAGSTNGVRVEPQAGVAERGAAVATATVEQPVRLPEGARIVLSARAEGPAGDYPWLALRSAPGAVAARITPIASAVPGPSAASAAAATALPVAQFPGSAAAADSPRTPLTAILPASRTPEAVYKVTAFQAGGVHTLEVRPAALPVSLGRSRNQALVIDRRHEGVSGHHLDIVALDEAGATVQVHGDNGVIVDGVAHPAGSTLRWAAGATMVIGAAAGDAPTCTLTLSRKVD